MREADQSADHIEYVATAQLPDQRLITELEDQVTWLRQELEDRKREHNRDRDDWRNEIERLHTLMAQQGQTLQALSATVQEVVPEAAESTESDGRAPQGVMAWLRRLLGG